MSNEPLPIALDVRKAAVCESGISGVLRPPDLPRFRAMLDQGFLDEVQRLQERGDLDSQLPALRAVGYRQAWMYLRGELSADEWVERALIATRQYAKRQLTWLRAESDAYWVDPQSADAVARVAALIKQAGAAAT